MKVLRAYKIRCYPDAAQRRQFAQAEGACRYVHNRVLREMGEACEAFKRGEGERKTVVGMSREVTQWKRQAETAWLADIPSDPLSQELRDLDAAFKNFFAGRARHPRKKRKQFGCSIRFAFDQRHAGKVRAWAGRELVLPVLGKMRLAQQERLPAQMPKLVTLSRDGAGRYFASFAVEVEVQPLPATGASLGVDVGVKDLAATSDGGKLPGAKALRGRLRHLKRQQRALSRKQGARRGEKQSGRYRRQARRVGRLHAKIADARRDALHKASAEIVRKADVIALEDLNVKGMMASAKGTAEAPGRKVAQKAGLNRRIADGGFAELRRQVEYKAAWHGRTVLLAGRFAPTSKTCSECGRRLEELPLSVRAWTCPACGAEHDRDVNAARNILKFAIAGGTGEGGATPNARGGLNTRRKAGQPGLPTEPVEARTECGHADCRPERQAA